MPAAARTLRIPNPLHIPGKGASHRAQVVVEVTDGRRPCSIVPGFFGISLVSAMPIAHQTSPASGRHFFHVPPIVPDADYHLGSLYGSWAKSRDTIKKIGRPLGDGKGQTQVSSVNRPVSCLLCLQQPRDWKRQLVRAR